MDITKETIDIVCRQTTYTEDESIEKLIIHSGDPLKVIQEYMSIQKKERKPPATIYGEIRDFMKTSYEQRPENLKL